MAVMGTNSAAGWIDSLPRLLLESSLKATLVLAIVFALLAFVKRASSAHRHALWTIGLLAILALPLLALGLPELRWLPAWLDFSTSQSPGTAVAWSGPALSLLVTLWAVGAASIVFRLLLAQASLARLARTSRIADEETRRFLRRLVLQSGASIEPLLLVSSQRPTPMTWGVWRPKLLLPEIALGWPKDRLEAAVLHELAHIQRRDCLSQVLSQLALALFWFHPLVWYANRRIRIEREQACDDWVLGSRQAIDYAQHLLSIAAGRGGQLQAVAAMNMAQPSLLERRVRSILDSNANRSAPSSRRLVVTAVSAILAVSGLAMLKGGPRAMESLGLSFGADSELARPGLAAVRHLRDLGGRFEFASLSNSTPQSVPAGKPTPSALLLVGRHITDQHLEYLRHLPSLTAVHLDNTNVSDKGLRHLSQLRDLKILALNHTDVTDNGLKHLQSFSKLRSLSLSNTHVTSAGLNHLLSLRNLTTLQIIGTRVSSSAIQDLKRQLRSLTVQSEPAPILPTAALNGAS